MTIRQTDRQTNKVTFVLLEAANFQSPLKNSISHLNWHKLTH
jgi:hypothetical protein